jgi:hypothetical protein
MPPRRQHSERSARTLDEALRGGFDIFSRQISWRERCYFRAPARAMPRARYRLMPTIAPYCSFLSTPFDEDDVSPLSPDACLRFDFH